MQGKVKFLFNDSAHNVASVHSDRQTEGDELIYFIYLFKKIFIQL